MPKIPEKKKGYLAEAIKSQMAAALKKESGAPGKVAAALRKKGAARAKPLTAREVFDQLESARLSLSQTATYLGRLAESVAARGVGDTVVYETEDDIPF